MEAVLHCLVHAAIDTLHLIPFLYITYVLMEALERYASDKIHHLVQRGGSWGALVGAICGVFPQCGFSAAAATLYSAGVISMGTVLAVFLSTSDELLPIFIAEHVPASEIATILGLKVLVAIIVGLMVDALLRARGMQHVDTDHIHDLCEAEHCECDDEEGSIWMAALKHTVVVSVFIYLATFAMALVFHTVGEEVLTQFLIEHQSTSVIISALVGLIPNCAASVLISQLYIQGVLSFAAMMSGLLVAAGVGLLVLFRTNRHMKQNVAIVGILFVSSVLVGFILQLLGIGF